MGEGERVVVLDARESGEDVRGVERERASDGSFDVDLLDRRGMQCGEDRIKPDGH